MALLQLQALPRNTTAGTVVRLLIQVGRLDRGKIGTIEILGKTATVEVPDRSIDSLVKSLDGTQLDHHLIRAVRLDAPVDRGQLPAEDQRADLRVCVPRDEHRRVGHPRRRARRGEARR